jgi:hypothetical protein
VRLVNDKAYFTYNVDLDPDGAGNVVKFIDKLVLSEDGRSLTEHGQCFQGPVAGGQRSRRLQALI